MGSVPGFVGGVEPVRPRAGLDDVSVEGESVDDGSGEPGVGEGGAPFGEGGIGGAGDRGFLLARSDDLEQQFGAAGVEPDVSDFVEAEQIQMGVAGHDPGQLSVVGGLDQLIGQGGGGDASLPLCSERTCSATTRPPAQTSTVVAPRATSTRRPANRA